MISFDNFVLTPQQIDELRRAHAKQEIKKYIKEHGTEPADITDYFTYTEKEYDKYKRVLYANSVVSSVEELPFQPVKPEEIENTPEQEDTAAAIADAVSNAQSSYTAGENETINNVTIPTSATKAMTINGPVQDGATITNEGTKGVTVNNTGEDPISVTVSNSSSAANITLKGDAGYNDIYAETNKLTASAVNGTIVLDPVDSTSSMSVSAGWQDDSRLYTDAEGRITVSNTNSANEPSVKIDASNATIVMSGGQYNVLDVTCADNTLEISGAFHAKKLIVRKGSILYGASDIHDLVDELVTEGELTPVTYEISNASISGFSKNGVSNVVEDVVSTSRVAFGLFANGTYRYNLNGHTVSLKGGNFAAMYFRGTNPTIDFYGPGKIVESSGIYGIWTNSENTTVNIYNCDVEAYTHVLYAEKGTINVYGGSFKLLDENPELDSKGHCKFLLNCYDANYTAGTAKINVYGGKFYNFNPAETYGEPNGPVSYVAEGYHVVETVEDGVPVFEVVAD